VDAGEVEVAVDEPRDERPPAAVDDPMLRTGRSGIARFDRRDPLAVDDDVASLDRRSAAPVDDTDVPDDRRHRSSSCPWRGRPCRDPTAVVKPE
jgi:hypothetical protein